MPLCLVLRIDGNAALTFRHERLILVESVYVLVSLLNYT